MLIANSDTGVTDAKTKQKTKEKKKKNNIYNEYKAGHSHHTQNIMSLTLKLYIAIILKILCHQR